MIKNIIIIKLNGIDIPINVIYPIWVNDKSLLTHIIPKINPAIIAVIIDIFGLIYILYIFFIFYILSY